ncbi:MAG: M55 family metallopeptidase [Desulfosarcinaceae bacterium]|nr:M55 family metallopeptidase [Desulfosarcinaceae bacterium]
MTADGRNGPNTPAHLLIIADIEGSSGCWQYADGVFLSPTWPQACAAMTADVNAVVRALFDSGVKSIRIKDFHRTGYNLMREGIDPRATLVSGYHAGPFPGLGDPGPAQAALFLGMHAASGSRGFLAHTLTSRISDLRINSKRTAELELFAAALAPLGIRPLFFSGCPVACDQAAECLPGITTHPISKEGGRAVFNSVAWRKGLAAAAVSALNRPGIPRPYSPQGPFTASVTFRDGHDAARRHAAPWGFSRRGATVMIASETYSDLYRQLVRLCYLSPLTERFLPLSLRLFNLRGKLGLAWARRQLARHRGEEASQGIDR